MSIIKIKLIENDAELCSFSQSKGSALSFVFENDMEGYLKIGEHSRSLFGREVRFDLTHIPDGLLSPQLIKDGIAISLPRLSKRGYDIRPIYPSPEQYHALAERERALKARVEELESTVKDLFHKVYGEPLFEFPAAELISKDGV